MPGIKHRMLWTRASQELSGRFGALGPRDLRGFQIGPIALVTRERAGLVLLGCVKRKRSQPSAARDLYDGSPLWRRRRAYAERCGAPWYILSAKHGLLAPDDWIEPYDLALKHLAIGERRDWSRRVLDELHIRFGTLVGMSVECHAGKDYLENGLEAGLRTAGAVVWRPLAGIRIGAQLSWYTMKLGTPVGGERHD